MAFDVNPLDAYTFLNFFNFLMLIVVGSGLINNSFRVMDPGKYFAV